MVAVLLPMGRISGEVTIAGKIFSQAANGFGDPLVELTVNMIGPGPQKNIPDLLRYEPGFSMDFLVDLVAPIGEYESSQALRFSLLFTLCNWFQRSESKKVLPKLCIRILLASFPSIILLTAFGQSAEVSEGCSGQAVPGKANGDTASADKNGLSPRSDADKIHH